jgi:hypothetical protein
MFFSKRAFNIASSSSRRSGESLFLFFIADFQGAGAGRGGGSSLAAGRVMSIVPHAEAEAVLGPEGVVKSAGRGLPMPQPNSAGVWPAQAAFYTTADAEGPRDVAVAAHPAGDPTNPEKSLLERRVKALAARGRK